MTHNNKEMEVFLISPGDSLSPWMDNFGLLDFSLSSVFIQGIH